MPAHIPPVVSSDTEEAKPSSIAILPPEILCHIFSTLLHATWSQTLETGNQLPIQYNFSQVCRAWRGIALAEPTLWRFLDFEGTKWTELLVQRSRATNLLVNARACQDTLTTKAVPEKRFKSMLSVLPSNLWRLEELVFYLIPLDQTAQLLSNPDDETPYPLRHVSLTTMRSATNHQEVITSFIRRCHNLQSLRLTGPEMYKWDGQLPSSLTSLELSGQPRPSTKEFLSTLRGLPRLQDLRLRSCGPLATEDDPPFTSLYTINLPFLQNLILQGVNMATESYYQYLNIPPTTDVEIFCQNTPAQPSPQQMLDYLIKRFQDEYLPWPTLRRAHLLHFMGSFQITLFPTVPEMNEAEFEDPRLLELWKESFDTDPGPTTTKSARIRFEWEGSRNSWWNAFPTEISASFFTQIHQTLPFHHLQYLLLMSVSDLLSSDGMDELVTGLEQLVLLTVHAPGRSWWSCLLRNENRALGNSSPDTTESNRETSSLLPLPKLSRLQIILDEDMIKKENELVILLAYEWIRLRTRSSGKLRVLEFNFFTQSVPPPTILSEFEQFAEVFNIRTLE